MAGMRDDSLYKVVEDGIKRDIEVVLDHERYRAAVILIYAGMDSMAYLDLPAGRDEVKPDDFIRWADRYMSLPADPPITGEELYGARCGLLHTSRIESKRSRAGKCRMIGYSYRSVPDWVYNAQVRPDLVMISIETLKRSFFAGINDFLIAAFASSERKPLVTARMETMVQPFRYPPPAG